MINLFSFYSSLFFTSDLGRSKAYDVESSECCIPFIEEKCRVSLEALLGINEEALVQYSFPLNCQQSKPGSSRRREHSILFPKFAIPMKFVLSAKPTPKSCLSSGLTGHNTEKSSHCTVNTTGNTEVHLTWDVSIWWMVITMINWCWWLHQERRIKVTFHQGWFKFQQCPTHSGSAFLILIEKSTHNIRGE